MTKCLIDDDGYPDVNELAKKLVKRLLERVNSKQDHLLWKSQDLN